MYVRSAQLSFKSHVAELFDDHRPSVKHGESLSNISKLDGSGVNEPHQVIKHSADNPPSYDYVAAQSSSSPSLHFVILDD
jgi:hypothetical protein